MLPPIRAFHAPARPFAPRRAGGPGFTLPEATSAAEASVTGAVASPPGLIGFQSGWGPAERDAAAGRRGSAVLRELEALQLALLAGGPDPARISRLALLAEGEAGADPALREIIEGISLRARVELARLAPFGLGQSREIASGPCTWGE